MDNNQNFNLRPELPTPELNKPATVESGVNNPEQSPKNPGELSRAPQANISQAQSVIATLAIPVQQTNDSGQATATPTQTNQFVEEESQELDKEIVARAKKIVDETKTDPVKQTSEISKLKVDYIKRRFGKNLVTKQEAA